MINLSDRWQHEVAAYRLDRMIGLDLVPVTVRRTISGAEGSLSFWVDGLINEMQREAEELPAAGWCSLAEQWPLMFVFDALVYNEDRTKQNMVYGRDDWMMYLIDHSRSFRTHRGRPKDIRSAQAVADAGREPGEAGVRGLQRGDVRPAGQVPGAGPRAPPGRDSRRLEEGALIRPRHRREPGHSRAISLL